MGIKRILFVGNANSFLIYQLAKQIKKVHPNWVIDILSEHLFELDDSPFDTIFAINHHDPKASRKYVKSFFLSNEMRKLIKRMNKDYDWLHILYLSSAYRFIWNDLKSLAPKRVITVFGGDFYKSNFIMKWLMKKMVKDSNIVSATNSDTLAEFSSQFKVSESKQQVVRFGLSILDEIDTLSQNEITEWKRNQSISKDKLLIACGYNKSSNQNLPELVRSIINEKDLVPQLILCFQFPGDETTYTRFVINLLNQHKIDYRIFNKRFSDRELAIYRSSINMMVQVQNSDSFSGAMQEHLYSGSLVITGKWLPYGILDNQGVDYIRVNTIEEVGKAVAENVSRFPNESINKAIIEKLSKWSITINSWINLYVNHS